MATNQDCSIRAVAVAALLLLAIAGAWNHCLWAYDEPREVELARAMYRSGQFAYMELGNRPFLDKPPLFCWSVALAFGALGRPSVLLARLVTAAWALGTLGITAWLGRRLLGAGTELIAALVLATTYRFYSVSHEVLLDNALLTATTGAVAFGAVAVRERSRGLAALAALSFAAAFLTKGIVGVGIAGLVLSLDLAWRRDAAGLAVLLSPCAWLPLAVPVGLYVLALERAAGTDAGPFLVQLFWNNQIGRFSGAHGQHSSDWYLYLTTWPETLAFWVPFAAAGLVHAGLEVRRGRGAGAHKLLLAWSVAPLLVLSLSKGRARSYALPLLPAYALLVAALWRDLVRDRDLPRSAAAVAAALVGLGVLGVVGAAAAIAVLAPDRFDGLEAASALLALAVAGVWIARRRDPGFVRSEGAALLGGLLVVAAFVLYSGRYIAARFDRERSYEDLARTVENEAPGRTVFLFHVSNSYSGTFGFCADRVAPEFDEGFDRDGRRLLAALATADSSTVVLAPASALGAIPPEPRRGLHVIWSGLREDDRDTPWKRWALLRRRSPDEAPADPLTELGVK